MTPARFDQNTNPENNSRNIGAVDLHTYDLALGTTAEYSNLAGPTITSVMNNVTSVMNQVNSVYERDVAIRIMLIDNSDETFFFNAGDDPYSNGDLPTMLTENQVTMVNTYGSDAFDIGHVFGTNAGGLANLGSVCNLGNKARGASSRFGGYFTDLFFIIVSHEMGHQFNATHTFNLCDGDNETASTGYEPGSGVTIMSYSGASNCTSQYIEDVNVPYFHVNSVELIQNFSRDPGSGGGCATIIPTNNNMPTATILTPEGLFIPISTPFELTGMGEDPEGDDMTYTWEQYDLGPPSTLGMPMGTAPLFRYYPPTDSPIRILPNINDLVANTSNVDEILPTYTRQINWRFLVRDNNLEAGGWHYDELRIDATETAGPFLVTSPNDGTEEWEVGDYVEVTWDVANTDNTIVNCQKVNIRLSTDGGFTYPITLAENEPNDGSANVSVPDAVTANARIRVEAADNIFFDISNENFNIIEPTAPGFAVLTGGGCVQTCWPQTLTVDIETASLLNFDGAITFSIDGDLPPGAVATFVPETVNPGEPTVLTIDFTDTDQEGIYSINVQGTAAGADTEIRTILTEYIYNNFEDIAIVGPNTSATAVLPTFEWTGVPHADTYIIEVATSPTFDNIVYSEETDQTSLVSGVTLEEGTQYFWRVSASNECGISDALDLAAFQTVALACNEVDSPNDPLPISPSGLDVVSSTISISQSGVIDDLNIKNIIGTHDSFGDIEFELTAPNGESRVLVTGVTCFVNAPFNFSLDDDTGNTNFGCPPINDGSEVKPNTNSLADFVGLDVNGDWTLTIRVTDELGNGGLFEGWTLEFCGGFSVADPFVQLNEEMCVIREESRAVSDGFLIVEDNDNNIFELTYTLVTLPSAGILTLNGEALAVGDNFTQADIQEFNVYYQNTDPLAENDDFSFTVIDGVGGFLGLTTFNIDVVDEADCITDTESISIDTDILLYPNPANEQVFLELKQAINSEMTVTITDVQGRILSSQIFDAATSKMELNTSKLASGVYFVSLLTTEGTFTKKLTIE